MKVLILSHMYPVPFNPVYGIFVHKQVKALANAGVDVRVVSPVPWAPWPLNRLSDKWRGYSEVPDRDQIDGITAYYPRYLTYPKAWSFSSSGERMFRGIRGLVLDIRKDFPFDLIHAHVALPDGYAASMLAEEHGCPFVVTIHGHDLQQTIHRNDRCKKAIGRVFFKANHVLTVSSKLQKIGKDFFPESSGKFSVVPNGVDLEDLSSPAPAAYSRVENGPKILSVSNLVPVKGIDLNIRAIHRLIDRYPNISYSIIGDGRQRRILEDLAKTLGMKDRVTFLGRIAHREVIRNINECDIFCLPSWNEAFGVVYIEAMACGKPVIGCKGEGIVDFVEHGINGMLVEPQDVDDLAEKLDHLTSHPEKAKEMGEKARELVLEKYTWGKIVEKIIAVFGTNFKTSRT